MPSRQGVTLERGTAPGDCVNGERSRTESCTPFSIRRPVRQDFRARVVGAVAALILIVPPAPAQTTQPFDPAALDLAWTAPLRNTLHSLPVVDGDTVYMTQGFLDHTALHAFPVSCGTGGAVCERSWRGRTGATPSGPVVADGVVYVGSGAYLNLPLLLAFPVSCRTDGRSCDPLWQGIGDRLLVVTDGVVYAAANSHQEGDSSVGSRVYAYDVACGTGGEVCEPRWFADLEYSDASAMTSGEGMIFATTGHPEGSILYAFQTTCDVVDGRCEPAWTAVVPGSFGGLIVADGFAYVTGETGVFAFPTKCGTDGATCLPAWIGATPRPTYGGGQLAVSDGVVYLSTGQRLFAFPVGCGSGGATCSPLWKAGRDLGLGFFASDPVAGDGMVVVGGSQLFAFESACASNGDACAPAWVSRPPRKFHYTSPKTISDGFVLLAWGRRLLAFPLSCGTEGEICPRVWGRPVGRAQFSPPVVADGSVYYVSDRLYAFQAQT